MISLSYLLKDLKANYKYLIEFYTFNIKLIVYGEDTSKYIYVYIL